MAFALLVGALFASPETALYVFAVLVLFSAFMPKQQGVAYGIVLETWANYIIERFWKDNPFLKAAYDDSQYVVAGRIVHIPQPGSKPAVVKNRSSVSCYGCSQNGY
jgi:hypothetical protein